jgi:hypothetical protein
MLGIATGYYSGTNYVVNYSIESGQFVKQSNNTYLELECSLQYYISNSNVARIVINYTASLFVPTGVSVGQPYGVDLDINFNTLGLDNYSSNQLSYDITVSYGASWHYYNAADIYSTPTSTQLKGVMNDYGGDNRIIERQEYSKKGCSFSAIDEAVLSSYARSEGYHQGYDAAVQENELNTGIWGLLEAAFNAANGVLSVEILPGIKLWYLLGVPLAFGLIAFFLNLWR